MRSAPVGVLDWRTWRMIAAARTGHYQHDQAVRRLWRTARRLRTGQVVTDPVTGRAMWAERRRGYLFLAVTDPRPAGPTAARAATVTRYQIGVLFTAAVAPLKQLTGPLNEDSQPMPWRGLWFAHRAGLLDATSEEVAQLQEQLDRAVAAGPGRH